MGEPEDMVKTSNVRRNRRGSSGGELRVCYCISVVQVVVQCSRDVESCALTTSRLTPTRLLIARERVRTVSFLDLHHAPQSPLSRKREILTSLLYIQNVLIHRRCENRARW